MTVNQTAFLGLVFLSVILYYLAPKKQQWCVLLGISLVFYYLMGVDNFLYVLITSASLTWGTKKISGLDQELQVRLKDKENPVPREERKLLKNAVKIRKRRWLTGIIAVNLGILLVLKYGDFFIENVNGLLGYFGINGMNRLGLIAPLGISYYTLQGIGYALEVYKGKVQPENNPLKILLFVTYYPQMTQGPIGRYPDLAPQLFSGHDFSYDNLAWGCQRILWGLFKKAVISDNLRPLVKSVFDNYTQVSGFTLLLGCIYMVFQMYADFSGYTDIVCGISRLYGVTMMENFKRPLFSRSLGEYWRRWHISLSSWFRDYVFYPASISRGALRFGKFGQKHFSPRIKKVFPVVYAMAIVWFCTGLWHDASWRYILWGVANGVVLIAGVVLEPQLTGAKQKLHINEDAWWWKGFCMLRTFLIVALLKVFPAADTTGGSFVIISRMLFHFRPQFTYQAFFMDAKWFNTAYAMGGLLIFLAVSILETRTTLEDWMGKRPAVVRWAIYLIFIAMIGYLGNFDAIMTGGFEYAQF